MDISFALHQEESAFLYLCQGTGYKFWKPFNLAGKENFYKLLTERWPTYYRENRWEYSLARKFISKDNQCLEIGCGRGFFMKSIENRCCHIEGIDFNQEAIETKVCKSEIRNRSLSEINKNDFDCVLSFQVLEHITNPYEFLKGCLNRLKTGGILIVSVPNDDSPSHQEYKDAFNMPPHHMGQYNRDSIHKISDLLGMELIAIKAEPAIYFHKDTPSKKIHLKILRRLKKSFNTLMLRAANIPGHTMVAILRKN